MFPQHPQLCHAPFLLAHHLYRKPNFVYQPTVQPSFFTPHPVTMQCLPYIETYNTGHQAETEQGQLVVPEHRGRSRNRGYGQRSAPRRNRIAPDLPRNRAPKQEWRRKAANGNPVNDGSLQIQPSRKQPKKPIPLESGGEKTTVMIRNIPSKYTYIWPLSPIFWFPWAALNHFCLSLDMFSWFSFFQKEDAGGFPDAALQDGEWHEGKGRRSAVLSLRFPLSAYRFQASLQLNSKVSKSTSFPLIN